MSNSLCCTPETNVIFYVNYAFRKISQDLQDEKVCKPTLQMLTVAIIKTVVILTPICTRLNLLEYLQLESRSVHSLTVPSSQCSLSVSCSLPKQSS